MSSAALLDKEKAPKDYASGSSLLGREVPQDKVSFANCVCGVRCQPRYTRYTRCTRCNPNTNLGLGDHHAVDVNFPRPVAVGGGQVGPLGEVQHRRVVLAAHAPEIVACNRNPNYYL